MLQDLIEILITIKGKLNSETDVNWTHYNNVDELRKELDLYIRQLRSNDLSSLDILHGHFLPTCTFQELSISNGWADEYINLAGKFDAIYKELVSR